MMPYEPFVENLRVSGLLSAEELRSLQATLEALAVSEDSVEQRLVRAGVLTPYQAEAVRRRHFAGLTLGPYVLLGKLGSGGMGTVYQGRHRRMKRLVAVKLLTRGVEPGSPFLRRFQREIETVSRL